jgi:hypothetical protein
MSENSQAQNLAVAAGARIVRLPLPEVEPRRPVLAEEQLAYARLLDGGMKLGFLLLVITFGAYVLGFVAPHVPVEELARYWSLPVNDYLAATGIHAGWGWVRMLHRGDFLNFVGIAFLSGVTIACYVAITPIFFRKRDRIYGALAVVEVLVLALAASGVLKGAGH